MDQKIVLMIVVAIVLGMLVANMFKDVCGCKVVEGLSDESCSGVAPAQHTCQWKWGDEGGIECPKECESTSGAKRTASWHQEGTTCEQMQKQLIDAGWSGDKFCNLLPTSSCCAFRLSTQEDTSVQEEEPQEEEPQEEELLASEDPLEEEEKEEKKLEVVPQELIQTITFNEGCLVLSGGGAAPVHASVPVTVPEENSVSATPNPEDVCFPDKFNEWDPLCKAAKNSSTGNCLVCLQKNYEIDEYGNCAEIYCGGDV